MSTDVLTRADYTRKKRVAQAGTVSELMEQTITRFKQLYPDWRAKHWHLSQGPYGLALGPVNLTTQSSDQAEEDTADA